MCFISRPGYDIIPVESVDNTKILVATQHTDRYLVPRTEDVMTKTL